MTRVAGMLTTIFPEAVREANPLGTALCQACLFHTKQGTGDDPKFTALPDFDVAGLSDLNAFLLPWNWAIYFLQIADLDSFAHRVQQGVTMAGQEQPDQMYQSFEALIRRHFGDIYQDSPNEIQCIRKSFQNCAIQTLNLKNRFLSAADKSYVTTLRMTHEWLGTLNKDLMEAQDVLVSLYYRAYPGRVSKITQGALKHAAPDHPLMPAALIAGREEEVRTAHQQHNKRYRAVDDDDDVEVIRGPAKAKISVDTKEILGWSPDNHCVVLRKHAHHYRGKKIVPFDSKKWNRNK